MKKITIIGGGLSALSASCYLAKSGFDVTIIEKNESMGGRLSSFRKDGFTFDMGPSWYWMPDVFDSFFEDFNKSTSDYYELKRLDPSYKFFMNDDSFDFPASMNEIYDLFDRIEPGSSQKLKNFLSQAKMKYEVSMDSFIHLPNLNTSEYFDLSILKHALSLDMFTSLRKHIAKYFKSKKLRDILEFPSMFLGGSPSNTPALYSLMNYGDIELGTWYPMGGMYKIAEAFESLSLELGVKHIAGEEVSKFNIEHKRIDSVCSINQTLQTDVCVSGMEYPHTQTKILGERHQSYSKAYWNKKNVAPSALIFYLGLSKKVDELEHHNLFFDRDFDLHLDEIFTRGVWPSEPLFYVCCPSKTDPSVVPDSNHENLFILVPIGSGSDDSEEIRQRYLSKILDRIKDKTGVSLAEHIVTSESFCVNDFKQRYNAFRGNAYGLANTLTQTALFKPKMRDKKISNLYYCGHFTVPGPGLPPAIISGKIVATQIKKDLGI